MLKAFSISIALLMLGACTVHQSPIQTIEAKNDLAQRAIEQKWQAHKARLHGLDAWKIKGKIAVKAGKKGGHATLRWDKRGVVQAIEIFGPLGGGRVEISADETGARLKDTKGGELQGQSIAALIEQRLGWPLPFDQLPYWLRGLPAEQGDLTSALSQANISWNEFGHITAMNDAGWQVTYPKYQAITDAQGHVLQVPKQIELNALPGTLKVFDNKGEFIGEDFFIRLIIKSWLP